MFSDKLMINLLCLFLCRVRHVLRVNNALLVAASPLEPGFAVWTCSELFVCSVPNVGTFVDGQQTFSVPHLKVFVCTVSESQLTSFGALMTIMARCTKHKTTVAL